MCPPALLPRGCFQGQEGLSEVLQAAPSLLPPTQQTWGHRARQKSREAAGRTHAHWIPAISMPWCRPHRPLGRAPETRLQLPPESTCRSAPPCWSPEQTASSRNRGKWSHQSSKEVPEPCRGHDQCPHCMQRKANLTTLSTSATLKLREQGGTALTPDHSDLRVDTMATVPRCLVHSCHSSRLSSSAISSTNCALNSLSGDWLWKPNGFSTDLYYSLGYSIYRLFTCISQLGE